MKVQIDDTVKDATDAEVQRVNDIAAELATAAEQAAAARASVRTKLAALGLTDAELAALLGS